MDNIILWIIIGVLGVSILSFIATKAIKIFNMTHEERKSLLITYLKGLVALAEQSIGGGHGAEKLELVEKSFKNKAPFIYKVSLMILGKDSLKELIEEALKEIKESFEK